MDTQEYLTPAQVAKRLRVHRDTVMRWIRTGALHSEVEHQGKRVRHHIPKSEIQRLSRGASIRHWYNESGNEVNENHSHSYGPSGVG